jgi:hypothetical protein
LRPNSRTAASELKKGLLSNANNDDSDNDVGDENSSISKKVLPQHDALLIEQDFLGKNENALKYTESKTRRSHGAGGRVANIGRQKNKKSSNVERIEKSEKLIDKTNINTGDRPSNNPEHQSDLFARQQQNNYSIYNNVANPTVNVVTATKWKNNVNKSCDYVNSKREVNVTKTPSVVSLESKTMQESNYGANPEWELFGNATNKTCTENSTIANATQTHNIFQSQSRDSNAGTNYPK